MKKSHLENLSANALQLIVNQLLGLGVFYILSTGLSKNEFGQLSLALAILLSAFNIFSCGIDQLIVKKIAAGDDRQSALSLYITHTLLTGVLFYAIVASGYLLFPNLPTVYNLLLLIGIGKLMIYLSTPYKQAAAGLELFKLVARISVVSNAVRCGCLIALMFLHKLNLTNAAIIFIAGDLLEFATGIVLFKRSTGLAIKLIWDKPAYIALLKEGLPQMGVVLITSSLARFDWIFIGFMLSTIKLAEYSFAYKLFEVAMLPLSAISPLLIPRFTKMFKQGNINISRLQLLVRVEMIVAAFTIVLLNIYWSPVIDWLTNGKYGATNAATILILSLCLPMLYLENFLWTIFFAEGKLKMILNAFIITLVVNIAADLILIPIYKNEGAAMAFLLACLAQIIFYLSQNKLSQLNKIWKPMVICTACSLGSVLVSKVIFANSWLAIPMAIISYLILLLFTAQIKLTDKQQLKAIASLSS